MKIRPNIRAVLPGMAMLFVFIFVVIFLSVLFLFEDKGTSFDYDLKFSLLLSAIGPVIILIILTPSFLFESLEIFNTQLIHKTLLKTKVLEIKEITKIQEIWRRSSKGKLVLIQFKTESEDKILAAYKRYMKEDIYALIKELQTINPNIKNTFAAP